MKLLVDACAGRRLASALRAAGHDVDFVGDWGADPGDNEILETARTQQRSIVTRDKDFGTLAVLERKPHCGIIRLVELPPGLELPLCLRVLDEHAADLERGCLITAEPHRIRIREPELGQS
jgi:predicted nuclease of predicted toxin-antitoxin system